MDGHPWDDPHGPGSPLARLVAVGVRVLMLGAPWGTMTLLHHAEALAQAPGRRFVTYEQPISVDGERVWRTFRDIESSSGAFDHSRVVPEGQDVCEVVVRSMLAAGLGRESAVGAARSCLVEAGPAVDFGVGWIEEHLNAPA